MMKEDAADAQGSPSSAQGSPSRRYVSFILGTGRYCVPVDQVMQIIRPQGILSVPKAAPFVPGVINLRGDVIPVVSLRARLGISDAQAAQGAGGTAGNVASRARIIIIRMGSRVCGLMVDDVREIVDINEASVQRESNQEPGAHAQFTGGVAQRDGTLFLILDLQRVLSAGQGSAGRRAGVTCQRHQDRMMEGSDAPFWRKARSLSRSSANLFPRWRHRLKAVSWSTKSSA